MIACEWCGLICKTAGGLVRHQTRCTKDAPAPLPTDTSHLHRDMVCECGAVLEGEARLRNHQKKCDYGQPEPGPAEPPEALALMAALVMEDGRRWGEVATDWQRADAAAMLTVDGPRMHYITRPRGGSKTTDVAGVVIAVLAQQAPAGSRSNTYASDNEQALLLLEAIRGLIARTPGLSAVFEVLASAVTYTPTGATLTVETADAGSAYGMRPYLTICDEFAQWPEGRGRRLFEAIASALPKRPDSRIVLATTPGDPAHFSRQIYDDAQKRNVRWRVSSVQGPLPWVSAEDLEEQKALLPASAFARLHLGQWVAAEDALVSMENLRRCLRVSADPLPAELGREYLVTCDIGLRNDATVVVVGHKEDRLTVVDRIVVLRGTKEREVALRDVEELLRHLSRSYNGASVVADPWNAAGLLQRLREAGLTATEFAFTATSVGRLAASIHVALRDGLVSLPNDPDLIAELAGVRLRTNGSGVMRLDHASGAHDDQAVAIALLVLNLTLRAEGTTTTHMPTGRYKRTLTPGRPGPKPALSPMARRFVVGR